MKQEHPGREAQESPGFSRGEEVNPDLAELRRLAEAVPMPGDDPDIIGRWWDAGDLALYPVSHRQDREFIQACSPDVVLALLAERDALAAKVERVRDWLDHRGVDVSDRDGAYMDGYRAAQRHAFTDAAELRAALDGAES